MDIFYVALVVTTISMFSTLALVFFDNQIKTLLPRGLYRRIFTLVAVVTVGGILWATTLSYTTRHEKVQAAVVNHILHKP